jgi:hypothetical protein
MASSAWRLAPRHVLVHKVPMAFIEEITIEEVRRGE